jgi:histidinol-phosphatase (PHP family)
MDLRQDYHVHSNYSDGYLLPFMIRAAEQAGLDAVGFADHCNVSEREAMIETKHEFGFTLDSTYERRRTAFESLRERTDLRIYDAVEIDYDPADEHAIEEFLAEADFDYAIGSVHFVDDTSIQASAPYTEMTDAEREAVVDQYYEILVSLIDSEYFEIAAHLDLPERTPELRGYATEDHYAMVAEAFEHSSTVPELNAGRALSEYGEFHPATPFAEYLRDRSIPFVPGTDSHRPPELRDRLPALAEAFETRTIDPTYFFDEN